jgi:hypothetical protein
MRTGFLFAAAAALIGLAPGLGQAQVAGSGAGGGYSYLVPPLTVIQRNQQNQLEANRFTITKENQGRFQNQLDLEKMTYDEERRERESYLFQDNTSQRALEIQLREQDLRLSQQDQDSRARALRQRQEEDQIEAQTRAGLTGAGGSAQ